MKAVLVEFLMVILILFICRELVQPTEMVSADARQIHMGAHLGPPLSSNSNVIPSRGFPGTGWNEMMVKYREVQRKLGEEEQPNFTNVFHFAGYGFLPTESMETVARRQELFHKQNIARYISVHLLYLYSMGVKSYRQMQYKTIESNNRVPEEKKSIHLFIGKTGLL